MNLSSTKTHPRQVIILGSVTRNDKFIVEQAINWLSRYYKTVIISQQFCCKANCLVYGKGDIADRLIQGRASDNRFHLNEDFDVFILPNYGRLVRKELLHLTQYRLSKIIMSTSLETSPGVRTLLVPADEPSNVALYLKGCKKSIPTNFGMCSGMAGSKSWQIELTNTFFKMLCKDFGVGYLGLADDLYLDDPALQSLLEQTIAWTQSK